MLVIVKSQMRWGCSQNTEQEECDSSDFYLARVLLRIYFEGVGASCWMFTKLLQNTQQWNFSSESHTVTDTVGDVEQLVVVQC
mmetsp:Transcript_8991/g.13583  ORF Transcript_8991/g.13583 Transcript_8991/m.13583 type:complete len:83 (-) Transcript_8991:63-311(-)